MGMEVHVQLTGVGVLSKILTQLCVSLDFSLKKAMEYMCQGCVVGAQHIGITCMLSDGLLKLMGKQLLIWMLLSMPQRNWSMESLCV
nr:hypothetical protein Iba_chr02bCG6540 [Ipomoea batatas]GMC67872.1 hypothetical protein Iba_chr02fCG6540 [Ipomoea batatas]